jgi:hypothetical protein
MKRRLLNLLTLLSLLLCVAVSALWIRSRWVSDYVALVDNAVESAGDHGDLSQAFELRSGAGVFALSISDHETRYRTDEPMPPPPPRWQFFHWTGGQPPLLETSPWGWRRRWRDVGLGVERFRGNQAGTDTRFVALPYWLVMSAGAIPLYLCVSPRLRRSKRLGLCSACGYDLRATLDRCPECGVTNSVSSRKQARGIRLISPRGRTGRGDMAYWPFVIATLVAAAGPADDQPDGLPPDRLLAGARLTPRRTPCPFRGCCRQSVDQCRPRLRGPGRA